MSGLTVWFTGLSSSGKTTISQAVREKLLHAGHKVEWLDGDAVRQHISKGLGYSKEDRDENIRRIGFVAELLSRNGVIVIVSAISPSLFPTPSNIVSQPSLAIESRSKSAVRHSFLLLRETT